MDSAEIYKVIGLMSGTSLDGLDIVYSVFRRNNGSWKVVIKQATTLKYSSAWAEKLSNAHLLSGLELMALDSRYGEFLGECCAKFVEKHKLNVDFIASHGHTIFHQPKRHFTFQLGNGNALHAAAGLPVVFDFRSLDVARGGEGAPLVPAGDEILFKGYDVCLNLGGIANLSCVKKGKRIAFDICFANMGLNYLASQLNKAFDSQGAMASSGEIDKKMLGDLSRVYQRMSTKRPSLGREIFEKQIKPILDRKGISVYDKLRTFTESTAIEITKSFQPAREKLTVLCTGGGAFNSFLIATMLDKCGDNISLVLPEEEIIKFKEAMVFAFLGVLRVRGERNCLKSVTGAAHDSSGGQMVGF